MKMLRDLRISLQAPRKTADAWYARWAIRPVSIYLTWLLYLAGLKPNHVTFLSLVSGFAGIIAFAKGHFAAGILSLHLWYLLDHVDGEMARLRKDVSLSGTFFDTVINFLVQPFTFIGWSMGLSGQIGAEILWWGAAAASGSLMLMAIPMTEEAVLFNEALKKNIIYQKSGGKGAVAAKKQSPLRRIYTLIHTWVTFPNVLFMMTAGYLTLLILTRNFAHPVFFSQFLKLYALVVTGIWMSQLFYKVCFHTLDRHWKPRS